MEQLAFESELGSKGHLSNIERGLARPTIYTLKVLADRLEVRMLDLVTFPDEDERQRLIDATRRMSRGTIRKILKEEAATAKKVPAPAPAEKTAAKKRRRVSGKKRSR
jgi:transcriptional regulator with XRE-family HTH domain